MREPGRGLLLLTRALGLTRLHQTVVLPAVADMQHEYSLATAGRGRALAVARGYWSILAGAALYAVLLPARHLRENWASFDAPGPRLLRQALLPATFVAGLCYGYVGLMAATSTTEEWRLPENAALLMLTGLLVMVTPAALSAGVGWVLARDRSGSSATILIGVMGAFFSFTVWEVAVTRAIDAYVLAPASAAKKWEIRKGAEMTFTELNAAVASAEAATVPRSKCSCANRPATLLRMEWHRRLSTPALALSFVILAAAVSRTGRRFLVIATLWPSYVATIWILQSSQSYAVRGEIPVPLAIWGGHVLPLALAAMVLSMTARRRTERAALAV